MKNLQKHMICPLPLVLHRSLIFQAVLLGAALLLSGCGALTGIPGHGGGKRFAVEQELVAASARGALKQIDLSKLKGKKVNLFVNAIGDTGAGNLSGGKFSVISQLRGDYVQTPPTTEKTGYQPFKSTTNSNSSTKGSSSSSSSGSDDSTTDTTSDSTSSSSNSSSSTSSNSSSKTSGSNSSNTNGSSSSSTTGWSETESYLPTSKTSQQKGAGGVAQLGLEYKGLGEYHNSETLFGSSDLQYFSALLHTYLFLKGVYVVPPSEAEIDIYITVDVFGTMRSRVEWFLANNEILVARTALEIMAVEHVSGRLVMPPQAVGAEAEYNEQYLLWVGPFSATKYMKKAEPLLCDFTDLQDEKAGQMKPTDQDEPIQYPFRHTVKKLLDDEKSTGGTAGREKDDFTSTPGFYSR
jgi:hypothetical protein